MKNTEEELKHKKNNIKEILNDIQFNADNLRYNLKDNNLEIILFDGCLKEFSINFNLNNNNDKIILKNGIFCLKNNYKISCISNKCNLKEKALKQNIKTLNNCESNNLNLSIILENGIHSLILFSYNFNSKTFNECNKFGEIHNNKSILNLISKFNKVFLKILKEID